MSVEVTFGRATALAMLVIWLVCSCSATTCIELKKFKVRQVCGQVQTVVGDVIPDATIQVTKKGNPDSAVRAETDSAGNFSFARIDEGEYSIRVDVRGFHSVSQEFEIERAVKRVQGCSHPLVVLMEVADGCSSISKVGKKSLRK